MKIVVVGGTGLIGSKLVSRLAKQKHEVIAASPSTGVDTVTGKGLAQALHGAQVVVDASNSPSLEVRAALEFFRTSCRNLLAAEEDASVLHHVALSVVGTDRLPESGYFRAKMAQENLIRASNVPYSILRSSPFFEYINGIVEADSDGDVLRVSPAYVEPIAADDVVQTLLEIALGPPQSREIELVGPERFRLSELAETILASNEDGRSVFADARALYFGAVLQDDTLVPRSRPRSGPTRFEDWLRAYLAETLAPDF